MKETAPQGSPSPNFCFFPLFPPASQPAPVGSNEAGSGLGGWLPLRLWKSRRNNQKSAKPWRENRAGAGKAPKILPPAGQGSAPHLSFPPGSTSRPLRPPQPAASQTAKPLKRIKTEEADMAPPGLGRATRPPLLILLSVWLCSRHRRGQQGTTGTPVSPPIPCPPPVGRGLAGSSPRG